MRRRYLVKRPTTYILTYKYIFIDMVKIETNKYNVYENDEPQ